MFIPFRPIRIDGFETEGGPVWPPSVSNLLNTLPTNINNNIGFLLSIIQKINDQGTPCTCKKPLPSK